MEMSGERRITAPRATVWEGLNDPEVLRVSIPGCESVERTAPDAFQARVGIKIGPMAAKFTGKVQLTNINAPVSYTIGGEGNGGAMGFAKGGADVSLEEDGPDATILRYAVKAQVGGKMAQLGGRLIDSTAKQMADQFFDRFAATVAVPEAVPASPVTGEPLDVGKPLAGLGAAHADGSYPADPLTTPPAGMATTAGVASPAPAPKVVPAAPVRRELPPATPISIFSLMPSEIFGLPVLFWGGGVVMLFILSLLFLVG